MSYPPMECEKCEECGYTMFECDCENSFDEEEVKIKDRCITSFGDVMICLIELEDRIKILEEKLHNDTHT